MKKLVISAVTAIFAVLLASFGAASAVTSPWSPEQVLLAKTGHPVSIGTPRIAGSSLVVPYSFKFGNLRFVAKQGLVEDSNPSILNSNGFEETWSRYGNPTSVVLATAPSGLQTTVWTEINRDEHYDLVASLVSDRFGVLKTQNIDEDSCSVGEGSYSSSCLDSLGFSDISAVAKDDSTITLSFTVKPSACTIAAKVAFFDDPRDSVPIERITSEASDPYCDPHEGPSNQNHHDLLLTESGAIVSYWLSEEDSYPSFTVWNATEWSQPTVLPTFRSSQGLYAIDRSDEFVTFVSLLQENQVEVIDLRASTGQVTLPKFEFNLDSGDNFVAVGDRVLDSVYLFSGIAWYRLDTNNILSKVVQFTSEIEAVYQSPSGRVVVETHGPQTSWTSSYSRILWARESGKLVKYTVPDSLGEVVPFAFSPMGDLVAISYFGSGEDADGLGDYGDGLKFTSLKLSALPRLGNPTKPIGTAKVGQTLRVNSPDWITYSKLTEEASVTWLSCSKAVTKVSASVPTGCNPIRNSSGLTYPLVAGDKGKHITVKLSATNATGTSTSVLPSIGTVK